MTKIVKCKNCNRKFWLPQSFGGTILCEDCDHFLKEVVKPGSEKASQEITNILIDLVEEVGFSTKKKDILAFNRALSRLQKLICE